MFMYFFSHVLHNDVSDNAGFPFLKYHSPVLSVMWYLKIVVWYISPSSLAVKDRRVNLLSVIPSWLEVEICVCARTF